jgi:hypothetical protein
VAEQGNGASPRRVLVVDDESNIAELIATALKYEGFEEERSRPCSGAPCWRLR